MAGGTFISMNKVRPGAYINFETSSASDLAVGTRGIVAMMLPLNWGAEKAITEVTGIDLQNGTSLAKIGLLSEDEDALPINLALQNASSIKIYNPRNGGTKAQANLGTVTESYVLTSDTEIVSGKTYYTRSGAGTEQDPYVYTPVAEPVVADIATYYEKVESEVLIATAKYPGTFGNKIAMLVRELDNELYSVETYANGYLVDTQKVANSSALVANDYVEFNNGSLVAISSTLLAGGTDGTTSQDSTFFDLLKTTKFHTLAHLSSDGISSVVDFITEMRNEEGKYVQAVVSTDSNIDYEGIINSVCGVKLEDETEISALQFVAWVAGATAGASVKESLTGKVVPNAISIVNPLSNDEIVDALQNGKLVLSMNQNGAIKVEKDINTLHTFTSSKNYSLSKNKVIRVLDEIGSGIEDIWETTYMGKVPNNDNGRTLFKSSIIDYLTALENEGAITDFDSSRVTVEMGPDVDIVEAFVPVKPVDNMDFLYITVRVEQQ